MNTAYLDGRLDCQPGQFFDEVVYEAVRAHLTAQATSLVYGPFGQAARIGCLPVGSVAKLSPRPAANPASAVFDIVVAVSVGFSS